MRVGSLGEGRLRVVGGLVLLLFLSLPITIFKRRTSGKDNVVIKVKKKRVSSRAPDVCNSLTISGGGSSLSRGIIVRTKCHFHLIPQGKHFFCSISTLFKCDGDSCGVGCLSASGGATCNRTSNSQRGLSFSLTKAYGCQVIGKLRVNMKLRPACCV